MLSQEPCKACTFSEQRAHCSSYKSQVKIFYEGSDRGVWSLGSNLILKDRGPELPTDDAANLRFVKENTTILVPTVIHQHETSNEHALTIMTRIPGENLAEAWPKLSNAEKENIAKQTAEYLLQLRLLHSDRIEAHGGRPVFNGYLVKAEDTRFHCPCGPLVSDEEVWTALARRLNPTIPDAARNRLRHSMPPTKPFTFTHQDLAHVNIMVQDGVLTGIVDRERAGYFPVWWEYAMTLFTGEGPEDAQWQGLLRKHMPQMDDVYNWFKTYYFLCLEDLNSSWARDFIEESEKDLA
ncbi:aminoglycoside phosphotransferase family protein [Aspergillus homomorphus CBS 101889]|uniref:Kinase-like protein n=1 Tax=Aspergillus homomorphus (strain CBS 101889) TaxID=1450537 RepID=A0A395I0K9_ASPHC|nr:kinase-like protein [Aspergillus homomorphus CBS 101889]RAL12678.1 kinase-like protein [Aspergillus homomorphus CBS 101889]